jgi:hypothetical protein
MKAYEDTWVYPFEEYIPKPTPKETPSNERVPDHQTSQEAWEKSWKTL